MSLPPLAGTLNIAKLNMEQDGELFPVLFVDGTEKLALVFPMPNTSEERKRMLYEMGKKTARLNPEGILLISDTYIKISKTEEEALNLKTSLADDPEASDAIILVESHPDGSCHVLVQPYTKIPDLDGDRYEWGETRDMDDQGLHSFLTNAYWKGVEA